MELIANPERKDWANLQARPVMDLKEIRKMITPVLESVKKQGDNALLAYTQKFDGVELGSPVVSEEEFEEAEGLVSMELKEAIQKAYENIHAFHNAQKENGQVIETMKGVQCWRKSLPIEKVGLYIPGGTAPLFSTILMLGIPAKIAGCEEIVLCSPPAKNGKIHPAILHAAHIAGITRVFKAGGAQAIAAMAYGTESIPEVFKIFGPGNQFVTAAKQLVAQDGLAIDMPAGPSEVMVVADKSAPAAFVASDLLAQAEHGVDSQVILLTDDENLIQEVNRELGIQLEQLPRKEIAAKALQNSRAILLSSKTDLVDFMNSYAAEHLILSVEDEDWWAHRVKTAGSVFLGHYSPESVGDYASGTNHTLPTNSYAKAYSGVSLDSFVKKITFQKLTPEGLKTLGPYVEVMAAAEELEAHKQAVSIRLKQLEDS
ncbi:MAG: histidinol dehydrogenase [Bacteroidia bacterium]|nr:histidinol dehydrogenase [Bacteroidia bacterium]